MTTTPITPTIHVVITGGTIDSHYDPVRDAVVPNAESVLPAFLDGLKLANQLEYTQVCMKDSRQLSRDDLRAILETVEASPSRLILVTHGTYTMPDTARLLQSQLTRRDQVVVLTGSMLPISGFSPSDGPFSLGFAIAKVQELPPGVYVCMNGSAFGADEVAKLISEGRFISLFAR